MKKFIVLGALVAGSTAQAASGPDKFSYEGRLYDSVTNAPSNHSVNLILQVLHPTPVTAGVYCILREEKISGLDLATTEGYFSVAVGSGVAQANDPGLSMLDVFVNKAVAGKRTDSGAPCTTTGAGGMSRLLRVTIEDVTAGGTLATLAPDVGIGTTPYALAADSLQGFTPADLLAVNPTANLTQSNLEGVFSGANFAKLQSLLAGTSSQYAPASSSTQGTRVYAGTATAPVAGSIWVEGNNLKFNDGSSTITVGAGGGGVTSIVTGGGLVGGPITSAGTISLDVSGVVAGTYGSSSYIPWFTADTYGRVIAAGSNALVVSASNISGGTLAHSVLPIIPVSKGGTNSPTALNNNRLTYTSGGAIVEAPALNDGQIFIGQTGAAPMPATLSQGSGIVITNAAGSITISATGGGTLGVGAVGSAEIADGTVAAVDLASNSVNASKIATNSINWSHLQDDIVTFAKMQNINSGNLVGRSSAGNGDIEEIALGAGLAITNGTLAATGGGSLTVGSVTTTEILDGTVSAADLATNAVTSSKIAANAVSTAAVADDQITFAKMQNINTNRLVGRSTASAGDMEELYIGGGMSLSQGTLGLVVGGGLAITNGTLSATGGGGDFFKDGSVTMTGALTLNGNPSSAQHAANKAYVDAADSTKLSTSGGAMTGQLLSTAGSTASPSLSFSGDTDTGILSPGADSLMIVTGGSNSLYIGGNSGIGIGTTTPLGTLDVRGPLAITRNSTNGVTFSPANVNSIHNYLLPSSMGANGSVLTLGTAGTLSWIVPSGGGDFMKDGSVSMTGQFMAIAGSTLSPGISFSNDADTGLVSSGANTISIAAGGLERARVDAGGITAFGTNTPLTINGTGSIGIQVKQGASNMASWSAQSAYSLAVANNLATQVMTVSPSGTMTVGHATSNPHSGAILDARGGAIAAGAMGTMSGAGGQIRVYELGATGSNFVGFRAPDQIFSDVVWTLPSADAGGANYALVSNGAGSLSWATMGGGGDFMSSGIVSMSGQFKGASGSAASPGISFGADSDTGLFNPAANTVALSTAGAQRLTVGSSGNVGVGTTNPSASFEVLSTSSPPNFKSPDLINSIQLYSAHGTSWSNSILFKSAATTGWELGNDSYQSGTNDFFLYNYPSNWNAIYADAANLRVGIGTSAPTTTLDVAGAISAGSQSSSVGGELRLKESASGNNYVALRAPTSIAANVTWTLPSTDGTLNQVLRTDGAGSLSWATPSGGDFMANGSVTMTGPMRAIAGSSIAPAITFPNSTTTGFFSPGANTLAVAIGGVERMRVDAAGNFGFGILPGAERMLIAGTYTGTSGIASTTTTKMTFSPSGASTAAVSDLSIQANFGGVSSSPSATLIGIDSQAQSSATATIGSVIGIKGTAYTSNTGTITNGYGGYFQTQVGSGPIANAYGVYIGQIQGTAKYSLYASDSIATSFFGGPAGFGNASPSGVFEVSYPQSSGVPGGAAKIRGQDGGTGNYGGGDLILGAGHGNGTGLPGKVLIAAGTNSSGGAGVVQVDSPIAVATGGAIIDTGTSGCSPTAPCIKTGSASFVNVSLANASDKVQCVQSAQPGQVLFLKISNTNAGASVATAVTVNTCTASGYSSIMASNSWTPPSISANATAPRNYVLIQLMYDGTFWNVVTVN